jgi:hypothetical protein
MGSEKETCPLFSSGEVGGTGEMAGPVDVMAGEVWFFCVDVGGAGQPGAATETNILAELPIEAKGKPRSVGLTGWTGG